MNSKIQCPSEIAQEQLLTRRIFLLISEEFISNKESTKAEIFSLLEDNKSETKTLDWIEDSVKFDKENVSVERLLTELWLESKVTKARFKSDDLVVYNSRK